MEPQTTSDLASDGHFRRGLWAYDTWGTFDTVSQRMAFLDLLQCYGATDVYLALGPARELLADAHLPELLGYLNGNGVRADALISPDRMSEDPGAVIADAIEAIDDYNTPQPAARRFLGVHVDYEPWIGTGEGNAWVDPLIAVYQQAAPIATDAGMPLVADINGPKLANPSIVSQSQRQAFFNAVRRLVLMQYDASTANIEDRTNRFLSGLTIAGSHDVIIAIRAEDHVQLSELAPYIEPTPGIAGSAVYEHPLPPMLSDCVN